MEDAIIKDRLQTKKWFSASKSEIQKKILMCHDDGFLKLVSKIEDDSEFGEVLKITDYWRNEKVSGVSFEIRSGENNQILQSDFICWNQGNNPLSRGIILIEEDGRIQSIVLESKYNLTTFDKSLRSFAMSFPEFSDGQIIKLPKRIAEAIPGSTIKKYIDLDEVYPEDTLINGKTALFAVIINVDDTNKINLSKVNLINVENMDILENIKDGYLSIIISKLKNKKII